MRELLNGLIDDKLKQHIKGYQIAQDAQVIGLHMMAYDPMACIRAHLSDLISEIKGRPGKYNARAYNSGRQHNQQNGAQEIASDGVIVPDTWEYVAWTEDEINADPLLAICVNETALAEMENRLTRLPAIPAADPRAIADFQLKVQQMKRLLDKIAGPQA